MKKLYFDPHKSLLELPIVRWTAFFLLLFFCTTIAIVIHNRQLIMKLDYDGLHYALTLFRIPIGIVALAVPIFAILAANHRSEQSREQMRLSSEQNIFSNHYKHVEEFEKYCTRLYERMIDHDEKVRTRYEKSTGILKNFANESFIPTNVNANYSRLVYKKIYPKSVAGDLRMSREFIDSLDSFILAILENAESFNSLDRGNWYSAIVEIDAKIRSFTQANYIDLRLIGSTKILTINEAEIRVPSGDVMMFMRQLQDIVTAVEEILAFDISYIPSSLVQSIVRSEFDELPNWDIDEVSSWNPVDVRVRIAQS
jgi:hypothetical protein